MDDFIKNHKDIVDFLFKIATMSIALFNIGFAIWIYKTKTHKDDTDKERDRKLSLLKTLVLDHNLKNFYAFFDDLEAKLSDLKKPLNDEEKAEIDVIVSEKFSKLRIQFTDLFLAVDRVLYQAILDKMDSLQEHITKSIFDPGVNLNHEPKYKEIIITPLSTEKTSIVTTLYQYRG